MEAIATQSAYLYRYLDSKLDFSKINSHKCSIKFLLMEQNGNIDNFLANYLHLKEEASVLLLNYTTYSKDDFWQAFAQSWSNCCMDLSTALFSIDFPYTAAARCQCIDRIEDFLKNQHTVKTLIINLCHVIEKQKKELYLALIARLKSQISIIVVGNLQWQQCLTEKFVKVENIKLDLNVGAAALEYFPLAAEMLTSYDLYMAEKLCRNLELFLLHYVYFQATGSAVDFSLPIKQSISRMRKMCFIQCFTSRERRLFIFANTLGPFSAKILQDFAEDDAETSSVIDKIAKIFPFYFVPIGQGKYVGIRPFQRYMQHFLARYPQDSQRSYLSCMIDYFSNTNNIGELLRIFAWEKQWDHFANLLKQIFHKRLSHELCVALKRYFQIIPQVYLEKYPYLLLGFICVFYRLYEYELIQQASELFYELIVKKNDGLDNKYLAEYKIIECAMPKLKLTEKYYHMKKADRLLNEPSELTCSEGLFGNRLPCFLYMHHFQAGQLTKEVKCLSLLEPLFVKLSAGRGKGAYYILQGEYLMQQGNFSEAERYLEQGLLETVHYYQTHLYFSCRCQQLLLAILLGENEQAELIVQDLKNNLKRTYDIRYQYCYHFTQLFLYLQKALQGNVQLLPEWILENNGLLSASYPIELRAMCFLVYNLHLFFLGDYKKIAKNYRRSILIAKNLGFILIIIYYKLIAAAAYYALRKEEAQLLVDDVLELALPDELFLPLAIWYKKLQPLMDKRLFYEHFNVKDKIQHLSTKLAANQNAHLEQQICLTEKEYKVGCLLIEGKNNSEIAEILQISVNTVRFHLKNIFSKFTAHITFAELATKQNKRRLLRQIWFKYPVNVVKYSKNH